MLQWKAEEATHVKNFAVQRSFDGFTFSTIANVPYIHAQSNFAYIDAAYTGKLVFYRVIVQEQNGQFFYSPIVKVNSKSPGAKVIARASAQNLFLSLENFRHGKYNLCILNTAGELLAHHPMAVTANGVGCYINRIWLAIYEQVPDAQVLIRVHDSLAGQFPTH